MIDLSYQLIGADVAIGRLSALRDMRGLDSEIEGAGDDLLPKLRVYPSERPNQRYRRSYRFRDSWRRRSARRNGRSIVVDLENPMPYGGELVGDVQGPFFVGRWWKLRTVAEEARPLARVRAQTWALRTWRGG